MKNTTKDVFEDPIWGQKTNKNKIALGAIYVIGKAESIATQTHVAFAVAKTKSNNNSYFALGGNQSDAVSVAYVDSRSASTYPKEYNIKENDYELPIYYRPEKKGRTT